MRITLNLATRPFADLGPAIKRLRIAMAVLAVLAIGLGFGLHAFDQKAKVARARDHSLDGQIAQITLERQGYEEMMRQPANAQVVARAEALNRLFDAKAFSWTLAMEDLETVLPGGVQVSTLEPVRAKDGHITLRLRVIGPRNLDVDLLRNLEHSKRFLLPRIVGENSESQEGPGERLEPVSASNRVDFDLLAEYNPASPEEHRTVRRPAQTGEDSSRHDAGPMPARRSRGRIPYAGAGQPTIPGHPVTEPRTNTSKPNPSLYPAPGGPQ
jgi:type IV pilus assembly protein PilN